MDGGYPRHFYLRSGVFTVPEFLKRRFDCCSRFASSGLLFFFSVFVDCAAVLYAGGLVTQTFFPTVPIWAGIFFLALLSGIMSIFGVSGRS